MMRKLHKLWSFLIHSTKHTSKQSDDADSLASLLIAFLDPCGVFTPVLDSNLAQIETSPYAHGDSGKQSRIALTNLPSTVDPFDLIELPWQAPHVDSIHALWRFVESLSSLSLSTDVLNALTRHDQYERIVTLFARLLPFCARAESYIAEAARAEFDLDIHIRDAYLKAYARTVLAITKLFYECPLFLNMLHQGNSELPAPHVTLVDNRSSLEQLWSNLANVAADGGKHILASTLYRRAACALSPGKIGPFHRPSYIDGTVNSAINLTHAGCFDQAYAELHQALKFATSRCGHNSRYAAWVESNLGVLLFEMGRFAEAERRLGHAISIWGEAQGLGIDDHLPESPIAALDALARLRRKTGDQQTQPATVETLQELCAGLESDIPEYIAARLLADPTEENLRDGIADIATRFGHDHPATIALRRKLATILFESGRRDDAQDVLVRLIEQAIRTVGRDHIETVKTFFLLGQFQARDGKVELARETLTNVSAHAQRILPRGHILVAEVLSFLATILDHSTPTSLMMAWNCVVEADLILRRLFDEYSEQADEARLLQVAQAHYELTWTMTKVAIEAHTRGCRNLVQFLECVWGRKARVVSEMRRRNVSGKRSLRLRQFMRRMKEKRRTSCDAKFHDFLDAIIDSQTPRPSCSTTFLNRFQNVVAIEYFRSWRPDHGRNFGSASTSCGDYFAILVHQCDIVRLVKLGDAGEIDRLVMEYRKAICDSAQMSDHAMTWARGLSFGKKGDSRDEVQRLGLELRRMVLDPVFPTDLGQLTQVTIAPDGALALLPFESLRFDDGTFLDDGFAINYVNALWQANEFGRTEHSAPKAIRVIGDPDFETDCIFGGSPSQFQVASVKALQSEIESPWRALPGSRQEADCLGQILNTTPIVGKEATSDSVRCCTNVGILHLATHGFYMPVSHEESALRPLRSLERAGLALAGANHAIRGNDRAANCILTAADLASTDLQNVDLVVLSACETGVGNAQTGEGVFGLRRAMWCAGVQTMVMSHWSVPDRATVDLMVKFYQFLISGLSCVESLQRARRALREAGEPVSAWGAFSIHGNPATIPWLSREPQ